MYTPFGLISVADCVCILFLSAGVIDTNSGETPRACAVLLAALGNWKLIFSSSQLLLCERHCTDFQSPSFVLC